MDSLLGSYGPVSFVARYPRKIDYIPCTVVKLSFGEKTCPRSLSTVFLVIILLKILGEIFLNPEKEHIIFLIK